MGKTTVLLGLGALLGERVLRWSVRERVSASTDLSAQVAALFGVSPVGDLATQLLAEPPRVVIVDDAHRLFLRRIGGFAALSELERLMVATGEHHFWVLAHDAWAWRYLRLRQRRALQGPSVITLRAWSALELRSWVTARTESAGFEVSFAQLDDDASSTEQGRSAGGYFSLLEEAAQGNPWCAGELWLAALSVEDGTAHVGLFSQKAAAQLRGVTDEGRFLLAALVQHDGLGAREVAEVLGVSVSGAQELLLDLVERGLVERGPDGIEHVVTRAAYRETVAFVRGHNLLHTGGAQ